MDILINTSADYLVIININTRFAELKLIPDRSTPFVLTALKSIFKKQKVKLLEPDEEAAFVSQPVLKYSKKKNADYYVVTEQRHNNLSIVSMFIRTPRLDQGK
jgi:hypothetical protein